MEIAQKQIVHPGFFSCPAMWFLKIWEYLPQKVGLFVLIDYAAFCADTACKNS